MTEGKQSDAVHRRAAEPPVTDDFPAPQRTEARVPDLAEIRQPEDILRLAPVLGHVVGKPDQVAIDTLLWVYRQIMTADVAHADLAVFCGVPETVIARFAEGGYARISEVPQGLVTGLGQVLHDVILRACHYGQHHRVSLGQRLRIWSDFLNEAEPLLMYDYPTTVSAKIRERCTPAQDAMRAQNDTDGEART